MNQFMEEVIDQEEGTGLFWISFLQMQLLAMVVTV